MANTSDRIITAYGVQAYVRDRKGLVPGEVSQARDEAHARRMARRLAEIRAGAVAFARRIDRDTEEYEGTSVLERAGELPENLDELLMV
jgi:hypothetical protein